MQATLTQQSPVSRPGVMPHMQHLPPQAPASANGLSVGILRTPEERQEIAHLRQYADFRSEYELDPGMASLEAVKDALGIVMAISLHDEPIATIRFIPTGHGVTLTERFWPDLITEPEILDVASWEVGRLVMAPEHRRADLLPQCMASSLVELLGQVDVRHMHASCLMAMTRLYRRFGFTVHAQRSKAGKDCALIHGSVARVAAALKVQMPAAEPRRAEAEMTGSLLLQ